MDASVNSHHGLHTVYSPADAMGDVPESTRQNVQNTEWQVLLHHQLGIPYAVLVGRDDHQIAEYISSYIFRQVDETRTSMNRIQLEHLLDQNIQRAIREIAPPGQNALFLNDPRRIQAIAQATYESIPTDVIEKFSVSNLSADTIVDQNRISSTVNLFTNIGGIGRRLTIDLSNRFWRDHNFQTQEELRDGLIGTTPGQIGIAPIPMLARNYPLNFNDALALSQATFAAVGVPPTKIGNQEQAVATAEAPRNITVKILDLLNGQTSQNAPAGPPDLRDRPISTFNEAEIRTLLSHRDGTTNRYSYWEQFVDANNLSPVDTDSRLGITALDAAMKVVRNSLSLYNRNRTRVEVGGNSVRLTVKNRALLSGKTNNEGTLRENLRNRMFTEMSIGELREVIDFNDSGRFPYWEQIIDLDPSGSLPTDLNDISPEMLGDVVIRLISRDWKKWESNREILNVAQTVQLKVKADDLLTGKTDLDSPAGLQNRLIADLTYDEVQSLFEHSGKKGDYPYWKKFIDANGKNALDLEFVSPPMIPRSMAAIAIDILMNAKGLGVTRADRIGSQTTNLFTVHRDTHTKHDEAKKFLEKLRTGSENPQSAAMAASLALRDRNIMAAVESNVEETKIRKELNQQRAKQQLVLQLKKLSDLKTNFRIPDISGTAANYQTIVKERTDLIRDAGAVGSAATWESKFCNNAGFPAPNAITDRNDRRETIAKVQQQLKEISEELTRYEEIIDVLKRIAAEAVNADVYSSATDLSRLVSASGVVSPTELKHDFNQIDVSQKIKDQIKLESDTDLEAAVKKNEESLKKIKDGGEKGDVLQHKIFVEHFKRQGLSQAEAEKSANYLISRSLIDRELHGQQETLLNDMFADHSEPGGIWHPINSTVNWDKEHRPSKIIEKLGETLHVQRERHFARDLVFRPPMPEWQQAPYSTLVTGYFSLKKLYEGGASSYINCPGSELVKSNMRTIAGILARRHVNMLVTDFGADLSDADRKQVASKKALSLETIEKILLGEAPQKYQPRIQEILGLVDQRIDRKRRALGRAAVKTAQGGLNAGKYSLEKTKNGLKRTWGQRRNIAAFAACSALGGPLGAIGFGLWKALKPDSSSSVSSAPPH